MWSTEQKASGMRAPRGGGRGNTWTSPSVRGGAHSPGSSMRPPGSSISPASQCAPWIAHGTTCSSRQKAARRAPGISSGAPALLALDHVAAPGAGHGRLPAMAWRMMIVPARRRCASSCWRETRPVRSCRAGAARARRTGDEGPRRVRALRPLTREPAQDLERGCPRGGGDARRASASRQPRSPRRARTTWAAPTGCCARRSTARSSSAPPPHPGRDARGGRPLPDRGGAHGGRRRLRRRAVARAGERRRGRLPDRADLAQRLPGGRGVQLPHGRPHSRACTVGPRTVSPIYEGMLKEEMDAAAERHPEVPTAPC